MLPKTTLLTRHVDDDRQREDEKGQESKGRSHGVPIWSTKCLTARWLAAAAPLVEADLQPVGSDRLAGTITNRQSIPLHDALLVFEKQVYAGANHAFHNDTGPSWNEQAAYDAWQKTLDWLKKYL